MPTATTMIEIFKIKNGMDWLELETFFTPRPEGNRIGNSCPFYKHVIRTNLRASTFSVRSVNPWNALPDYVVTASTLDSFKARLDDCWPHLNPSLFPR